MRSEIHYEDVIGGSEEEKQATRGRLDSLAKERDERFKEYEIEKTPEDQAILDLVIREVDEIATRFGGKPEEVLSDNIVLLRPGGVSLGTNGELSGGVYSPLRLKAVVERKKSDLSFAQTVAHELFHLRGYRSVRMGNEVEDLHPYREGISMVDLKDPDEKSYQGRIYFGSLEEAIVSECSRRVVSRIRANEIFREEVEAVDKLKNWIAASYRRKGIPENLITLVMGEIEAFPDAKGVVANIEATSDNEEEKQARAEEVANDLHHNGKLEELERREERMKFSGLMQELVGKSNGKIKDRDAVFYEFARAHFSGNYLPLARMVESILGKGSFRKLAEEFSQKL